ncbi:MAG: element excision factor XisI family protein [Bacteroidota bacterium]
MDKINITKKDYNNLLVTYVRSLAKRYNESLGSSKDYYAIVDLEEQQFQFLRMGWHKHKFLFCVLIHLSIHPETGNIWIQQNNTEIQIDLDLRVLAGVPNEHLVLGFIPASMRPYSEYAVA